MSQLDKGHQEPVARVLVHIMLHEHYGADRVNVDLELESLVAKASRDSLLGPEQQFLKLYGQRRG